MKWNKEQLDAIETLGQNTLVCASAGAGKTAVLVERLAKRCLKDRVSLDRIVAMTFTEAAASEMKGRLSKRLNEELNQPHADHAYIKSQLTLLQNTQISTIHSFCMMLIKKHYDVIGLDPAIPSNILSDGTLLKAKQEAFHNVLNQKIISDEEAIKKLCLYFSARSESIESLQKAVFNIINTASTSFNEEQWYAQAKQNYFPIQHQDDLPSEFLSIYFSAAQEDLDHTLNLVEEVRSSIDELKDPEKAQAIIDVKLNFLQEAQKYLIEKNLHQFVHYFQKAGAKNLVRPYKTPIYAEAKSELTEYEKECRSKYADFDMIKSWHNQTSPIALTLLDLAQATHQQYKENKKILQGLEFNDMENYAWEILQANDGIVAAHYKDFFKEVLVDEFQDTNEVQNKIIEAISNGKNAFRVGDIKQSIYRFRYAKPDLMRQLMHDENTKVIHLAYNYRSNQGIVGFKNDFFHVAMNVEGCKDQYLPNDCVQVGTDRQCETFNPVQFYAINVDAMKENNEESPEGKQLKATFIAQKILEMKETTPYSNWKDYVILTKSHADKIILKSVFDQFNIPYSIDAKEGFYQSECAHITLSFLNLVLNSFQEIPLTAVLLSPLYQMNDDAITKLFLDHGSIIQGCLKTNHPVLSDLEEARFILKNKGLSALLTFISSINNFYHDHLSLQQKTNFDFLFSKVSDFEKKSQSLESFLQEVSLNLEEKSDEAIASGSEDDVVRAMTIHHSKGLQFNVVFYWSTSNQTDQNKKDSVLVDSDLGIALHDLILPERYRFPSFHRFVLDYKNNLEDLEEAIRVLYVALTRPQQHLIIVDTVKELPENEEISLAFLKKRKGPSHLLLRALSSQENFIIHEVSEFDPMINQPQLQEPASISYSNQKYSHPRREISESLAPSQVAHINDTLTLNDQAGALYGTRLHELIEQLPNRLWTDDDYNILGCSPSEKERLRKLSDNPLYHHCLSMDILKEVSFHLNKDGKAIDGIIDFVAIGENEIILIDFKSDANVDEEELRQRYTKQLEIYKVALEKAYPSHSIQSFLYSFFLGKEVSIL